MRNLAMQEANINPIRGMISLLRHRHLVLQLAWHEISGRYRGSLAGLMWPFLTPLFNLSMYTFVFGVVLQARWGVGGGSTFEFALVLFSGLIVHGLLAECIVRAPRLITGNVSYVKQVVFPLEVLPVVSLIASSFHAAIAFILLIIVWFATNGEINLSVLAASALFAPLALITLGISWIISSICVYFRDVSQIVNFLPPALLFLSPVFYPAEAVPEQFRVFLALNPLTFVIENLRASLADGAWPSLSGSMAYTASSLVIAALGYVWFQRVRPGFGDVV